MAPPAKTPNTDVVTKKDLEDFMGKKTLEERINDLEASVQNLHTKFELHGKSTEALITRLENDMNKRLDAVETQIRENIKLIIDLLKQAILGFGVFAIITFVILAALSGVSTKWSNGEHNVEVGGKSPIAAPP
jgi:hypothetical protein